MASVPRPPSGKKISIFLALLVGIVLFVFFEPTFDHLSEGQWRRGWFIKTAKLAILGLGHCDVMDVP